jgi:hypothetical protein
MMGYNIHTNKATKPTQNIEFMKKNETLKTLTLNIALKTHLNNNKK